jgi:hypothetical protein
MAKQNRHARAQRSNPSGSKKESWFASLRSQLTAGYGSAISPRVSREVCQKSPYPPVRGRRECRTLGASAAARVV